MSSQGTKVTTDPQTTSNPKIEKPGVITSDSLAAESLQQGGSFGSSSHAVASQQPSASTTTNNTDTSSATTLQAAPDAEARQAQEEWNEDAQFRGVLGNDSGSGPATASSYLATNSTGAGDPRGKDLTEGEFDVDAPNASFNGDIGGGNDPGRKGLKDMQKSALHPVGVRNGKQEGVTDDGQFDVLEDASA